MLSQKTVPVKYAYNFYGRRWETDDEKLLWSFSTDRELTAEQLQLTAGEGLIRYEYLQVTSICIEVTHTHKFEIFKMLTNDGKHPIYPAPDGHQLLYLGVCWDYAVELWHRNDDQTFIATHRDQVWVWDGNGQRPDWLHAAQVRLAQGHWSIYNRD